ncbi:MAG: DUF1634 domain-containing protein [Gammaproteobacteria bacterium]
MKSDSAEGGRLTAGVIVVAVALSSALFVIGLALFLFRGGAAQPLQVHGIMDIVVHAARGIAQGQSRGFIEAGLLVLLLAPFLRLIASVINSARQHNWRFVVIGLFVMVLLLTGILLGTR